MALPEFPDERSAAYPESSQATTVLVLGIVGIIFNIVAPVAWILGNQERRAIDEGRRDPVNAGTANIGRILGIIGTVLMVLGLIAIVALVFVVRSTGFALFGAPL